MKYLSLAALFGVTFITSAARAAELVMFEQAGCAWCAAFDREIAPVYEKTTEGARAPLRRVTMGKPLPADLSFIAVERLTPLFVLVDNGREVGRIRGYPGEDHFWGLLGALIRKLDRPAAGAEPSGIMLHAAG
ncbi:MAG: transcriptional regulator [Pseudolabrys sp.]